MKYLITAMAISIIAVSCSKNDDDHPSGTNTVLADNTWTAGANTYAAVKITRNENTTSLVAEAIPDNGAVNQFFIQFSAFPASGSSFPVGAVTTTSISAAALINDHGVDKVYVSTGSDHLNATVAIVNGKIHVQVPQVWAKELGGTDSLQIAANLAEQ